MANWVSDPHWFPPLSPGQTPPQQTIPAFMSYFTEDDIPYHYALAKTFTVCDQYFASVLSDTTPNRMYFFTGTIDPSGKLGGPICDNAGTPGGPGSNVNPENPRPAFYWGPPYLGCVNWRSYPEQLSCAGISWAIYEENANDRAYNLEGASLNAASFCYGFAAASDAMKARFSNEYQLQFLEEYGETVTSWGWVQQVPVDPTVMGPNTSGLASQTVLPKSAVLPKGAADRILGPQSTYGSQFLFDLANGCLPQVSWIIPPTTCDEHPPNQGIDPDNPHGFGSLEGYIPNVTPVPSPSAIGAGSPNNGAAYISGLIQALMASDYWDETVFILVYDEGNGHFDHVMPLVAPPDTEGEYISGGEDSYSGDPRNMLFQGAIGLGFRVPCIIVSPWTVGGHVTSARYDHTSVLRFLYEVFGVWPENLFPPQGVSSEPTCPPPPPMPGSMGPPPSVAMSSWRTRHVGSLLDAFDDFSTHYSAAEIPSLPSTMQWSPPSGWGMLAPPYPQVWPPPGLCAGPPGSPVYGGAAPPLTQHPQPGSTVKSYDQAGTAASGAEEGFSSDSNVSGTETPGHSDP
jgi:phospholipase C